MINKTIQFFKTVTLDDKARSVLLRRFRDLHPEWVVTETSPDLSILPDEIRIIADRNPPSVALELLKLWVVYINGGVAASNDILFLKPIDKLLDNEVFFSAPSGEISHACLIGGEAGSPIIASALGEISNLDFEVKKPSVMDYLGAAAFRTHPITFCLFRSAPVASQYVQAFLAGSPIPLPRKILLNKEEERVFGVWLMGGRIVETSASQTKLDPEAPTEPAKIEASILEMGVSFGGAVLDAVKRVATGRKVLASPEEVDRRSWICGGNPGRGIPKCDFFLSESGRCSKCGCKMSIKIRAIASSCPEGKW